MTNHKCPTCGRLHQGDHPQPVQVKFERIQTTQPPDWLTEFRLAALAAGQTLSEWIGDCCVANLPAAVQRKLSDRRG